MHTTTHPLSAPPLEELAQVLRPALESNYNTSSITVSPCPDLRQPPFHLASPGLSGNESVADIGGPPNLFPSPRLDCKWSMPALAQEMRLSSKEGHLIGAGAGPWHHVGVNCELATNLSWTDRFENVANSSWVTKVEAEGGISCAVSPSPDCALMMNLYGSLGHPGPVLRISARGRKGPQASITELLRETLAAHYGPSKPISLGGVFVLKAGKGKFHVMPDFPQEAFADGRAVEAWLTFHEFEAPVVGLSVLHSADPEGLGWRMEHTHCFGEGRGGHYHGDVRGEGEGEVEYEGWFNVARVLFRVDRAEGRERG